MAFVARVVSSGSNYEKIYLLIFIDIVLLLLIGVGLLGYLTVVALRFSKDEVGGRTFALGVKNDQYEEIPE